MIDPKRINSIFEECVLRNNQTMGDFTVGIGLAGDYKFHPQKLIAHQAEIKVAISLLPDKFKQKYTSFLFMLEVGNEGRRWTDSQLDTEKLMALGNALGIIEFLRPDRKSWCHLIGGKPFVLIKD
jgi:hypothetical protein